MARRELFEISRSKTLRSRLASAASSETPLVGLRALSVRDRSPGDSSEVSIVGKSLGGLATRGTVAAFTSLARGEGLGSPSRVVAERRRDWREFAESSEDKLGDLWCRDRFEVDGSVLSLRSAAATVVGISLLDTVERGVGVGLVPNI